MMYFVWWVYENRHRLKRRWQLARSKPPKTLYEQIVVFDDAVQEIYRVQLPIDELYENLGPDARYIADTRMPNYMGAGLVYLAAIPLLGLPWYFVGIDIIITTILAISTALPFAVAGWYVGPIWGPKPQWVAMRYETGELEKFDIEAYFSPDDPEASFTAEMLKMRDLRMVLSGGTSRTQKIQLAVTVTLLVCLIIVLFFFLTVFGGA